MYFGCLLMKLSSWKQAGCQPHVTAPFSLGLGSGIPLLKYLQVVLHGSFPPQTELINVWLRVIMEGGAGTCLEKLLCITQGMLALLPCRIPLPHSSPRQQELPWEQLRVRLLHS